MPYRARFSRIFLKKEERLPSDVKPRVVEALREILMNPHVGVPLVGSTDLTPEIAEKLYNSGEVVQYGYKVKFGWLSFR